MNTENSSQRRMPKLDQSDTGNRAEDSPSKEATVATLLGVFQSRTSRVAEKLYVGLTISDLPTVTTKVELLNSRARLSIDTFLRSGLELPISPFDEFNPVIFRVVVPNPIDYQDISERQRAKDVLRIGVADETGKSTELLVSEVDLLDGIVASRTPWQAINHDHLGLTQDSVNSLYTAFLKSGNAKYALLFKPTLPDTSNKAIFASFVVKTTRQLLEIDAKYPEEDQHGYVQVAREYMKKASGGASFLDMLTTDDQGKEDMRETIGRLRHALSTDGDDRSFMKSKAELDFIGRLKFDDLMDMVSDMQSQAHRFFR